MKMRRGVTASQGSAAAPTPTAVAAGAAAGVEGPLVRRARLSTASASARR